MNKQYSPLKPYRFRFHEEWLIAILLVVTLFQVGFSLHESAGLARPNQTLSILPIKGESVAKQPQGHSTPPAPTASRGSVSLSFVKL